MSERSTHPRSAKIIPFPTPKRGLRAWWARLAASRQNATRRDSTKTACPRCQAPVLVTAWQCPSCAVHYSVPLGEMASDAEPPLARWRQTVIWLVLIGLALPMVSILLWYLLF
ncbi:hypothetical protein HQ393_01155 [Chitinibacter bivalviorum]|uniref:Uncharacterized protein n=1 Tax=Chitinibacter bivalviorum TaxID=2739434 RepID=A0A7H9BEB3_9NEIS|nr:hypothetical protein [Chitinibacter bivalviorum]QLG86959.1 hypothetical protein HQ393_01155 [Chitinibacter bivalviorum]